MKALKPSMREKKRYLLIKGKNLKKNVEEIIKDFIGTLGMSKTSLSWIKTGEDWVIVSVNRNMVDAVKASFCISPEKIYVKKVSGTLKKLKE